MKSILLCTLLLLKLTAAFADTTKLNNTISFESKIEALVSESFDLSRSSKVNKHRKIHQFTNNFAHQLISQLEAKDAPLNGHQLTIINASLSAYLKVSEEYARNLNLISPSGKSFDGSNQTVRWILHSTQLVQDFKQTFDLFYKNTQLRRVVKDQAQIRNSGVGILVDVTKKILNKERIQKLKSIINSYQENPQSHIEKELREALESGHIFKQVAKGSKLKEFYKIKSFRISLADGLTDLTGSLTRALSAGFGAAIGPVQWRKGRLYKNKEAQAELLKKLRPLDLILEKKAFKLTDYTIPGHWGHIGVWLGTEKQLREINMWNHPIIEPFQEKIRAGYSVYEVRRWGLVWDKLDHWMNIDKMAIVRHAQVKSFAGKEYAKVFSELFNQIGKKYDYSFDAMTANTITCTEIISLSYGPVNWPTTKVLGRHTLQPDNIASLSLYKRTPLNFVALLTGDKNGGFKFESKSEFAKLIGFHENKMDPPVYEKEFRKCKSVRGRANRRGGIQFKNKCWSEYQVLNYQAPPRNIDGNEFEGY